MIRLIVRIGNWLDARFPEKLEVRRVDYDHLTNIIDRLDGQIDLLRDDLKELKENHAATLDRVMRVETTAVHKDAVKALVEHVKAVKDEQTSLKASLGWSRNPMADAEIQAVLNGEPIDNE